MGSEPVERMNMRGVVGPTSAYRVFRSIDGLSTNVLPRLSHTKSTAANTTYGTITCLRFFHRKVVLSRIFYRASRVSSIFQEKSGRGREVLLAWYVSSLLVMGLQLL